MVIKIYKFITSRCEAPLDPQPSPRQEQQTWRDEPRQRVGGTENKLCNKAVSDINMYKKTCKWYNVCPMKRFYEEGKLDERWIKKYCKGDYKSCVRYKLEEKGEYHPDNMLPNGEIDKGLR